MTGSRVAAVSIVLVTIAGCNTNTSFERLTEARHLSAELLIQFTKAADAANRAVMADTDESSVAFAKQAEDAKKTLQMNMDALRPQLEALAYVDEVRLLDEFVKRFAEYRELDRRILELAVENTNLKAQRLSFGEAQKEADAFRASLDASVPAASPSEMWHVRALVATAVSELRAIQVAQAPHIAESDDAVMTQIEMRMSASEGAIRSALGSLRPLVPAAQPRLDEATAALDRFMAINKQIVELSRRNTNVRSLMLSLNEKAKATTACEQALRSLNDALAKRGPTASR